MIGVSWRPGAAWNAAPASVPESPGAGLGIALGGRRINDDEAEGRDRDDLVLDPEALLAWLQQPQKAWLQARGLRPGEGIEAVEDLEALELEGLQRYLLLNHELEEQFILGSAPDWTASLAGQGVLPAGAGAALEQEELQQRWQALQRQLASLGPCRREVPVLAGLPMPLLYAGDTQVVVQPRDAHGRGSDARLVAASVAVR